MNHLTDLNLKKYLLCSYLFLTKTEYAVLKQCISRMCFLVTLTTQLAEHVSVVAAETPGQLPGCVVHQYIALVC